MQKTVLVGVTGCVAAYKSCEIVRGFQKAGVRVKVVMTEHATEFVNPGQFRALTREPVSVGLFDDAPGDPIHHVSLAKEADIFLVAPCTANVLAKMAHGIADDLLTTTALASTAKVMVAPAMNVNMYDHPATQANIETLKARGVKVIEPASGYLACGDVGRGRLADVQDIVESVLDELSCKRDLEGKRVLVTTGPTEEPIDAVRFITNPSSGKTGFAIAQAASERGASVDLVTGPVGLKDVDGANVVRVRTALEMYDAVEERFDECDIAIFAAAVSDYRPANPSDRKFKKGQDDAMLEHIELVKNPDILATMGKRKSKDQVVVGFAAETDAVLENARAKLASKSADMIVANEVSRSKGFGTDRNEVYFVTDDNVEEATGEKSAIAHLLLDKVMTLLG